MAEKIHTGLLGRKGELLVTNRLLKDYEVFFPYFDRGIDLIVKKRDQKSYFTLQCRTRDFRGKTKRILTIKKNDFERMKTNMDFLVFVLYFGESKAARFIVIPIGWLEKIIDKIKQRAPVEKNYILRMIYRDDKITYEPKGLDISKDELDISDFIDDNGWNQLK